MNEKLTLAMETIQQRYEEELLPRYQQLESREQRIVLVAAVILPLMFIIFGWLLPLQDRQNSLRSELVASEQQSEEAERLALYLLEHAAELKAGGSGGNLLTTVERLARETKIRSFMTRIKPQSLPNGKSERLMVQIKNAPYDTMLRFIHALASKNLGLDSMKLQTSGSPGRVHIRAIITG